MEIEERYREGLLYLIFGLLSFLISIITYAVFTEVMNVEIMVANFLAWIFSVSFAYITNRIWVFETSGTGFKLILREMGKFVSGRIVTLIVEELILLVFITWLDFNSMMIKLLAQAVVILLNYVVSKLWVFDKEKNRKC